MAGFKIKIRSMRSIEGEILDNGMMATSPTYFTIKCVTFVLVS